MAGLKKWYYYLKSVKGRSVGTHVPQKQTLTWESESKWFPTEVLPGEVGREGAGWKVRHWLDPYELLEDGETLEQVTPKRHLHLGLEWVAVITHRERGSAGGREPPHNMPRSGFWVCPAWSLSPLGACVATVDVVTVLGGEMDWLPASWPSLSLASGRLGKAMWQPRGGAQMCVITPIYKARVPLVWEGLYSNTSTLQMLAEYFKRTRLGIANTMATGWERTGEGKKTSYMLMTLRAHYSFFPHFIWYWVLQIG